MGGTKRHSSSDAKPSEQGRRHSCPRPARSASGGWRTAGAAEAQKTRAALQTSRRQGARILIPDAFKSRPLPTVPMISGRLRNILGFERCKVFGDLDGRRIADFLRFRNCGKETISQIERMVLSVQGRVISAHSAEQDPPEPAPPELEFLSVGPVAGKLNPYQLPLSVRAQGVLRQLGVRRLRDLDGRRLSLLLHIRNCGRRTVGEIKEILDRARAGEFDASSKTLRMLGPADFLLQIDQMLSQLPARDRQAIELRLGGSGRSRVLLADIGKRLNITRERVRQIVSNTFRQFPRQGGPRAQALLERIVSTCLDNVFPLTPALLLKWAPTPWPMRYRPEFYVRAIGEMCPRAPTWPDERRHEMRIARRLEAISRALERCVRGNARSLPLAEALEAVRAMPMPCGPRRITAYEFLEALRRTKYFKVQFPRPDRPEVTLQGR